MPNAGAPVTPGNIDIHNRPVVHNPDGSISTVRSITVGFGDKTYVLPTVVGGRVVSNKEAIDHFKQTGEHLGAFSTLEDAERYSQRLHEDQAKEYEGRALGGLVAKYADGGPVTLDGIVVEGKRRKKETPLEQATRMRREALDRRIRAATGDFGKLIEGAVTAPGALARTTATYARTHTPGGALSDAARVVKGAFQDVVEHPVQTVVGALPVIGGVLSANDIAKTREAAAQARARGDERTAKTYEQIAAGTAMASMLPFGHTVGKGLLKEGEEAALREARKLTEQGLYSHAADVARNLPQEKGTPEQIKAMLQKAGVKPVELATSKFDAAFAGRPSVTKHEVAQHFEENLPRLSETSYAYNDPKSAMERWGSGLRHETGGEPLVLPASEEEVLGSDFKPGDNTRYREILLKYAPQELDFTTEDILARARQNKLEHYERLGYAPKEAAELVAKYDLAGADTAKAMRQLGLDPYNLNTVANEKGEQVFKGRIPTYGFTSGENPHWDENDVLAHLRLASRYLPEKDADTLHLEELQSDWAQAGRERGFLTDPNRPYYVIDRKTGQRFGDFPSFSDALTYGDTLGPNIKVGRANIPVAPHVTKTDAWVDLGLKRALREAAQRDHPYLTWTPGEQQARRYSLDRKVGAIEYEPTDEGTFDIDLFDPSGKRVELPQNALKNATPEDISKYLGNDIARQIANQGGERVGGEYRNWRRLSGLDLTAGTGAGQRKFYDEIVPKRMTEVLKTLGAKPQFETFRLNTKGYGGASGDDIMSYYKMFPPEGRDAYWMGLSQKERDDLFDRYHTDIATTEVPGFALDDELRKRILTEGFRAYAKGGAVKANDGPVMKAYTPSLRERAQIGGEKLFQKVTGREPGYWDRQQIEKFSGLLDFIPLVGDTLGVDETKRALDRKQWVEAGLTGLGTAIGAVPVVGDVAGGALRAGAKAAERAVAKVAEKGALQTVGQMAEPKATVNVRSLKTKYGLDEFITDLTPEQRAANRAAYPTPAYHGTPRSYGNEGAFTAFQDQNLGDEYMLDRRLGTHFARDPEVSNSFTHADWDKGTAALPGSHVLPVQLPPEHELLTVEQPLIPWTDPNSPDYRPMPNPGEVREPLHKTDQRAIEELIAVEAYKRDPELLARYLVQARAVAPEDASLLAKQLVAGHVVVLPHDGPTNLKSFVGNFGGNPYNDADRAQMVTLAREALRERGYKGLRYINTSKRETAGAADPTSYIIFDPKHVKSRFNRGTYDPNDPHLNKARGGIVAKYADGGLVKAVRAAAGGRTDEAKWKRIVASVKASGKGGAPGQWSARKAQLATQRYQASGGGYRGPKTKAQQSLSKWTSEDWGTKSGKPSTQGPEATGERYLPKSAREALTPAEYAATTRAKRKGAAEGKQFVKQPERIAQKTSRYR